MNESRKTKQCQFNGCAEVSYREVVKYPGSRKMMICKKHLEMIENGQLKDGVYVVNDLPDYRK